jgi:hypothetical protein
MYYIIETFVDEFEDQVKTRTQPPKDSLVGKPLTLFTKADKV